MNKKLVFTGGAVVIAALVFIIGIPQAAGEIGDCPAGYEWQRMSGVGCVQIDCADYADAHYSYTSACICGSAGSINENPEDPNVGCYHSSDYTSCPGCLYACIHADEECPDAPGETPVAATNTATANVNVSRNTNAVANVNRAASTNTAANQNVNVSNAGTNLPSLTTGNVVATATCADECTRYLRGNKNATVVSAEGEPPKCKCQIDVRGTGGEITQTVAVDGPIKTTYVFDPASGALISKNQINMREETERIRQRIGFRYTEEEIDALLAPEKLDQWFEGQINPLVTTTNGWNPQFWWQHFVEVLDHGFNDSSADFVDTHNYGRCGDSMEWLERNLLNELQIVDKVKSQGRKYEAFVSITGEKWSNLLNHTSLLIRPAGITNGEWEEIVMALKAQSGGTKENPGIPPGQLKSIDPRLLDAKVLDPYKKQITTVREFIKGWSYIRIS